MEHHKEYSIQIMMTLLRTYSHNREDKADDRHGCADDGAIKYEHLAAVLSDKASVVMYHPTLKSQIKAILNLLKTAFSRKKRNGFIIIGRGRRDEEMLLENADCPTSLSLDKHIEHSVKPCAIEK